MNQLTPEGIARFIALHPFVTFAVLAAALLFLSALLFWILALCRTPLWRWSTQAWAKLLSHPALVQLRWPFGFQPPLRVFSGSYLVLDLLAGFCLALLSLAAFMQIADGTRASAALGRFDVVLAAQLQHTVSDLTLQMFSWITRLADAFTQTVLCIMVALGLFLRRQFGLAACWIAAVAGNGLLTRLLKAGFARTRPPHEHGWVVEDGWSFPSGHSSGAVAVYGMLAYLLLRSLRPAWRLPLLLATITLILLVGYSRIVLHVHYFSDVLAGFTVALAWLLVCISAAELLRARARLGISSP